MMMMNDDNLVIMLLSFTASEAKSDKSNKEHNGVVRYHIFYIYIYIYQTRGSFRCPWSHSPFFLAARC
jgi:hypothetical protein